MRHSGPVTSESRRTSGAGLSSAWTDEQLLHAVSRGSEQALCLLHARYASRIAALARHLGCAGPTEVEGAVEAAFRAVWRQAACFTKARVSPQVWIVGMARQAIATEVEGRTPLA